MEVHGGKPMTFPMRMRVALIVTVTSMLAGCGPSDFEKEKLAFEQQKYKDEQAAKAEATRKEEEDKEEQKKHWMDCRISAEQEYNNSFKSWGSPIPGKPGMRSGPANRLENMENLRQRQNEQCDRNFPKGISW
jgi:hypothetical protein